MQKPLPQGSDKNFTWDEDRKAFNNPGAYHTNGRNLQSDVPVPDGMTQSGFDKAVSNFGDSYSQGDYSLFGFFGPNSNSAANNIIRGGGGKPPNYGEPGFDNSP